MDLSTIGNLALQRFSNVLFRSILQTPAVTVNPQSQTVVYTALDSTNVNAYLLAIKSFLRFYSDVRVVVQSDGTLARRHILRLQQHLPGVTIYTLDEARSAIECWIPPTIRESLAAVANPCVFLTVKLLNVVSRFHQQQQWILFDSDLLFLREPTAIVNWIHGNAYDCFHGGGGNTLAKPFREMGFDFNRVDIGRFNAGFFGFRGLDSTHILGNVFGRIRQRDPDLFTRWEIEQAIWAVLLNSCSNPLNLEVLASDYVGTGWSSYDDLRDGSILVHFVGSTRFANLSYIRLARQVIGELHRHAA